MIVVEDQPHHRQNRFRILADDLELAFLEAVAHLVIVDVHVIFLPERGHHLGVVLGLLVVVVVRRFSGER